MARDTDAKLTDVTIAGEGADDELSELNRSAAEAGAAATTAEARTKARAERAKAARK